MTEEHGRPARAVVASESPEVSVPEPWIAREDELICLGHEEDIDDQQGALAPPVVQTSLFAQADFDALVHNLGHEFRGRIYTRGNNPTVQAVEQKIAALERGSSARLFGSGMGAVNAALTGLVGAGDHVLFVGQTYGPTLQLAQRMERFGVEHSVVFGVDLDTVAEAVRPTTKLLWLESPSTMVFQCFDLAAVIERVQERAQRRVWSVIDNSWATPLFQKPLQSGVDLVLHSATKYIGGHSDVVAGALVGNDELMERLFFDSFLLGGAALGPWDAWLLNRGLRTLPTRMRAHHRGGYEVARFLTQRPEVKQVFHPGLEAAPDDLDAEPTGLGGWSGLFSFELDVDSDQTFATVRRFLDALQRFRLGVSWGGVESLAIAPAREGNREALERQGIPYATVRLSIGLEPADVLCADLGRALDEAFAAESR